METLRAVITSARERGIAVGHFNFANLETLHAIASAARALDVPVIVGTSEGEREFFGTAEAVAVVSALRAAGQPIYLNADHCRSAATATAAIAAGYDAVIIDAAGAPLEANVALSREVVAAARASGRDVLVEGELGWIGTASALLDAVPEGAAQGDNLTTVAQAEHYVRETGVDLLAPAVGNIHGMLKTGSDPALNIERLRDIAAAVAPVGVVLHGASGNSASDVAAAVAAGTAIIHISTELRRAYRDALVLSLQHNPDETTPYKIMQPVEQALERVVTEKLKLCNRLES